MAQRCTSSPAGPLVGVASLAMTSSTASGQLSLQARQRARGLGGFEAVGAQPDGERTDRAVEARPHRRRSPGMVPAVHRCSSLEATPLRYGERYSSGVSRCAARAVPARGGPQLVVVMVWSVVRLCAALGAGSIRRRSSAAVRATHRTAAGPRPHRARRARVGRGSRRPRRRRPQPRWARAQRCLLAAGLADAAGLERHPGHVRPAGRAGAQLTLGGVELAVGVDEPFEGEEVGSAAGWRGRLPVRGRSGQGWRPTRRGHRPPRVGSAERA